MYIDQISVFIENKPGTLSAITGTLAQNDIDIKGVTVSDTMDYGILRCIVNNPPKAVEALTDAGFTASITRVLAVEMTDVPGGLHQVLELLKTENINVDYIYSINKIGDGLAGIIIKTDEPELAAKQLTDNGIHLYAQQELTAVKQEEKKEFAGKLRQMLNDSDRF